MRAHDWTGSPLGPPATWPQSLRSALSICLNSSVPVAIYWGSNLALLYNDAWRAVLGERHPAALGQPGPEVWGDFWEMIGPQMAAALNAGDGFSIYDQILPMAGEGRAQESYWNYSFTPIRGEEGRVVGIFNQGYETTHRVFDQRRARFLLDLTDKLRALSEPRRIMEAAQEALGHFFKASRVGYGEVDDAAGTITGFRSWIGADVAAYAGTHDMPDIGNELFDVLREGGTSVIPDVRADPRTSAPASLAILDSMQIAAAITASLVKEGALRAVLYVHAHEQRSWSDREGELVGEVAERTWSAIERARAEQRLHASESRYRALATAESHWVFQLSPDWSEMQQLNGGGFLVGTPAPTERWIDHYVEPADRPALRAAISKAVESGDVFEVEHRIMRSDGRPGWSHWRAVPVRNDLGEVIEWLGTAIDITPRRRAEEALRESEAQLRELNDTLEHRIEQALADRKLFADLIEGTDTAVQIVDLDYRLLAINKASADEHERLYGIRPRIGDLVYETAEVRPEQMNRNRAMWGRVLSGEEFATRREITHPSGESRFYEMKYNALRDASGAQIGAYRFTYDVSNRVLAQRRLEEVETALRHSQKMEAMGQLTGGVAHDFNNLLTPIVGTLDLLEQKGVGSERDQRLIRSAAQSAERARTLVQRLLAFARRQPLQPIAVDLAKLVCGMADLVASTVGSRIALSFDTPEGLPAARADPHQLEMALLNLAVNARDAMPDGGALRIALAAEAIGPGHRSGLRTGSYVRLSVEDDGMGMNEETRARAIEPFFSTKGVGEGTGLGLSMAHGLASQLGGSLDIESRPGAGTRVDLWLPQSEVAIVAAGPDALRNVAPLAPGRVLVVDDEELVRMSTAEMLVDLGYVVIEAASAEEALARLADEQAFDILVTDHLMPGMNGTDLARRVRDRHPDMPILIVSGYADIDGIDPDFPRLAKPFRMNELISRLDSLVNKRSGATG